MEKAHQIKEYVDACTQTSPVNSATRDIQATNLPIKRVMYACENVVDTHSTPPERLKRVYPKSPAKPYFALNGSPLAVEAYTQRRIVSHPETITTSSELSQSILVNPRCISMPGSMQHFATSIQLSDDSGLSGSFSVDETDQSRHHLASYWSPNSLPPTPDSVEIIDNSFRLPDDFLRHDNGRKKDDNDAIIDWISWASSPPRPIPALHGPASLPYARCPSGAEGTVIEEQSTVPGLIWGMNGDSRLIAEQSSDSTQSDPEYGPVAGTKYEEGVRCYSASQANPAKDEQKNQAGSCIPEFISFAQGKRHQYDKGTTKFSSTHDTMRAPTTLNQERAGIEEEYMQFQRPVSESARLDISAPVFVPNTRRSKNQPEDAPNRSINDLLNMMKRNELRASINAFNLEYNQVHSLPTPPNSTSPLWSSNSPVIPSASHHGQSIQMIPATNLGLNLLTPAVRSIDELAEQINQLNIQQQKNLETLARLNASAQVMSVPPHRNLTESGLHAHHLDTAPAMPKPEMPISLPDLVAQHTPGHTPEIRNSNLLPAVLLGDPVKIVELSKSRKPCVVTTTSATGQQGKDAYPSKDLGHRRPSRSVPFNRLHDRLASVPEEASFTDDERARQKPSAQTAYKSVDKEDKPLSADRSSTKVPQYSPPLPPATRQKPYHKMNHEARGGSSGVGNNVPSDAEVTKNEGAKQWKKTVPNFRNNGNGKPQAKTNMETQQATKNSKKATSKPRRK